MPDYWLHRHSVCGCRDFPLGSEDGSGKARDSAGSWRSRSFDTEPETGLFRGDSSRLAHSSLSAISVVRIGAVAAMPVQLGTVLAKCDVTEERANLLWFPSLRDAVTAADAGLIPAASTNFPNHFSHLAGGETACTPVVCEKSAEQKPPHFQGLAARCDRQFRPNFRDLFSLRWSL